MFLGTEMSTSMMSLSLLARLSFVMMGSLAPVAAKTTSLLSITSHMDSMPATLAMPPPRALTSSSSKQACALATFLLTTTTSWSGCLLKRASRRSLDILPAPRMHTLTLPAGFLTSRRAFIIMSSTAALDTDTEPLPILVLVRASLPILMAAFSIFETILPPEPSTGTPASGLTFSMQCSWQALTCARICASPSTRESRPEETSKRCVVASSPECVKRYWSRSSRARPDFCRRKACTLSMAAYFLSSGEAK
mmetsp:Transcript_35057/g.104173  ORF Transcript_35057/g.104173 Transcript_35057/m.104173 type:complete len:251 (+) Transcript_35057:387-1139(+)